MRYRTISALALCAALCLTACGSEESRDTAAESRAEAGETETAAEDSGEEAAAGDTAAAEEETAAGAEDGAAEAAAGEDQNVQTDVEVSTTEDGVKQAATELFAMDTYMQLTAYGEECAEAVQAAADEIFRLDALLSIGEEESEIYRINQEGGGTLSEETADMVEDAYGFYETTDGAFDITVLPLMELWGFTTEDYRVPEQSEIDETLQHVGMDLLTYDSESRTLDLGEAEGIDLGGIAKGYTSGRLRDIFAEYDLVGAIVTLGGNVQCYGSKPDGSLWKVGVQNPIDPDSTDYTAVIEIEDKAVITSGAYERNFTDEETGKLYHHIIDPATGYSAESGIISATIVSSDGMTADALSTSVYIMGLEKAEEYWKQYGESLDFDMILMTEDQEVYYTEGLEEVFESGFESHVIKR